MTLFDPRQIEKMERDLGSRRAGRSGGSSGPGKFWFVVLVVLAAAAGGVWYFTQRSGAGAAMDDVAAADGTASAAESARRALASRSSAVAAGSKPSGSQNLEQVLAEQREEQARIHRLREQEADDRTRRAEEERERKRRAERDRVATWWQTNRATVHRLDTAARQVVDLTGSYVDAQGNQVPAPGRVDLACRTYVAAFDDLLAGSGREAPSDELATALQRYLFYHQKGSHLCRTNHYQPAQSQLGSAATVSSALRRAVDAALSY